MRIVFLHLPKTAGQSVHTALTDAFGEQAICPARVNEQLYPMSRIQIARYRVFSGHFDWSLLDFLPEPKYVFTILRDPVERLLSFYFYLRAKASNMEKVVLERPEHQGLKAAIELSPAEYFMGGPPHLRAFLDDHYDNFYTYYFAARQFDGRRKLIGLRNRGLITDSDISRIAQDNLSTLDNVFTIDQMQRVFSTITELAGGEAGSDADYIVNRNKDLAPKDRMSALRDIGGGDEVLERIEDFTRLDNELMHHYR